MFRSCLVVTLLALFLPQVASASSGGQPSGADGRWTTATTQAAKAKHSHRRITRRAAPEHASRRAAGCGWCVTVSTVAGPITVDRAHASAFVAFFADVKSELHYVPRQVTCYSLGHKYGSNHDGGGACDVDQRCFGCTTRQMHHVGAIAARHGLFDGKRYGDAGHIEALRGLCNYGQCSARHRGHGRHRHHRRQHR